MEFVDLDNYGLRVVNFNSIFTRAYKDIVQDLYTYDKSHDFHVKSHDTKKIYYYHVIKHLCDTVISYKTDNRIVIYYSDKDVKCDFKQMENPRTRKVKKDTRPQFILFMNRLFKRIKSIIPIRVYCGDVKFDTFIQYYNTNKGKYLETINDIRSVKSHNRFDFSKFKRFTEQYKLVYLTEQYINQVKVKSIMYK